MITQAMKHQLIMKHAKKYAPKNNNRPILNGVHFAEDGSAVVTNSHHLLRVKGAHAYEEPFTSHVITGKPIEGSYPPIEKVFPAQFDFESSLTFDGIKAGLKKTKWAFEMAKEHGDVNKTISLKVVDGGLHLFLNYENIHYSTPINSEPFNSISQEIQAHLNAEYLYNAFQVFKDAGSSKVSFKIKTPSFVLLTDESNEIDVLIVQIKIHK